MLPLRKAAPSLGEAFRKTELRPPILLFANKRSNADLDFGMCQRRQLHIPNGTLFQDLSRRWTELDACLSKDIVASEVIKRETFVGAQRTVICAADLAGCAPHLKDVHEIGIKAKFDPNFNIFAVETDQRKAVEHGFGFQQLLPPDVDRIFRNFKRVSDPDGLGGQCDMRSEGPLRVGRQDHRWPSSDT